jgi:hypothetical protein
MMGDVNDTTEIDGEQELGVWSWVENYGSLVSGLIDFLG